MFKFIKHFFEKQNKNNEIIQNKTKQNTTQYNTTQQNK